ARAQVARLVATRRTAEARAARVRRSDAAQLRAVQRQESRIKKMILARAARAARRGGGYRGAAGGVLLAPVPGPVTSAYGWRMHPIYHYWGLHDGTDFGAACGTANRAVRSGTVISEDWSSVYGHRLYLDVGQVNGHNLTVVYNHLASYAVGAGARVSRGATVGSTGTTGWSTGCHLHFTVLRDGVPVDPMTYIS
ncbi:MAG: peptidase, partial [Marmoricola sp.]|nr:peptidase [Marmoricola sp.]